MRAALPKADFRESLRLMEQAKARLGPRPATLMYPQDKIEHMVVLFVENRASDHIWGCMLGDRPGFDGIPSSDARCGTATLVCHGKYQSTSFNASQLPIKAAIADSYGVHNRMFTSVNGPSWPNHNFAQSATSCGISSNVMYNKCGGPYPQFPQATIFDSLKLADVPFGLYVNMTCGEGGEEPCSKVRPGWGSFSGNQSTGLDPDVVMAGVARHADHFFSHDLFYKQAANGSLPAFSWISPPHEAADHPCMDLAKGERLLKDIYEALRAGKGWSKTLFVVTYDDYGGFDDHVPIPKAQPDMSPCLVWNKEHGLPPTAPTKCPGSYDFTTTGHRGVCAMMSPYVGKGAIFQTPKGPTNWSQYDHTSMLATAKSFFGLGGFLTERDKWAGTFDELLLDAPRAEADMPMHLPKPPKPATPWGPVQPYPVPPPPPPPPPPEPLPKGKQWLCFDKSAVKSVQPGWRVPSLNFTGIDYTSGFTGMASCKSRCNGCIEHGDCVALEYHSTDRHCVCYSGKPVTEAEFKTVLTPELNPKDPWAACVLTDAVVVEARRVLAQEPAGAAAAALVPQHCSASAPPHGACLGPHVVTQKQRNLLELYSALTQTPMPDVDAMGYAEAESHTRARWHDYMAMLSRE
eukprot:COSAG01_NODE_198_length_22280_cov_21.529775_19_plen_632_part_00